MTAVLLDLDGTLLRTPELIGTELAAEVRDLTGRAIEPGRVRRLIGRSLPEMASSLADGESALARRISEGYLRRYERNIVPLGRELLYPGVLDTLDVLRGRGCHAAVVTNKSHTGAVRIMRSSGLSEMIGIVVGADDVVAPKPAPDAIELALDLLGGHPDTAVMVGDTSHDVTAGRLAGAATVAVSYGVGRRAELESADAIIDLFEALPEALAEVLDRRTTCTAVGESGEWLR